MKPWMCLIGRHGKAKGWKKLPDQKNPRYEPANGRRQCLDCGQIQREVQKYVDVIWLKEQSK